ncbi:hypothetical protein [Paenibacillus lemnae]|uniref:Uncharacterized protein n=1 Tax=Paenibacillus lemnae TaxID=1330551 RepID=A0A848M9Y6_PAELE|nr:hypothetical protein [Paenibacillus lemnae]NMO97867.1 hypothetical protein [Paenibacillus lemnae]
MWMYVIVISLIVFGFIATLLVGVSQENKTSNPQYEKKTKANIIKLVIIYAISIIAFIAIWMFFD